MNYRLRTRGALIVLLALLLVSLAKLTVIQAVQGPAFAAAGRNASTATQKVPALRGPILDRNGTQLAFSVEGRAIAARPSQFTTPGQRQQVVDIVAGALGNAVDRSVMVRQLNSTSPFVFLARNVMPAQADGIMARVKPLFNVAHVTAVTLQRQDIRTNPNGALAAAVTGSTGWDGHGLAGIESKFDAVLTGTDGSRTFQTDGRGRLIPNTVSNLVPTVDGTGIRLTVDADLQYTAAQMLGSQVQRSQAKRGCIIVKGVSDGQIYALACYEPGKTAAQIGNPAVSAPFEPGSVNKVVTFAAALERGIITPTTVFDVPGRISMGGRDIHDAWVHSTRQFTATGILAKSSNVGTLMIAQKVGEGAFAQELTKFGLGQKTGIELPGESAGSYPATSQWSATTFANLPIGQGVQMTLLQLVDMYQAIANKGVLVEPTVIAGTVRNGVDNPAAPRPTRQVMKAGTAATLLGMLRATIGHSDSDHRGTGWKADIAGYQVAGKTGTAQQVDPTTKAYSNSLYNSTFAGIVPADNPKYAIAIMLDAPQAGSEGGASAAPLFHDVAAYAMRAADVPPSATPAPIYDLYPKPAPSPAG